MSKKIFFIILTFLFVHLISSTTNSFDLKWGLLKYNNNDKTITTLKHFESNSFTRDDNLKFIFMSDPGIFIYILYTDTDGNLKVLHQSKNSDFIKGKTFFYPAEKNWISFDTAGIETFDIVLFDKKNKPFDKLIQKYLKLSENKSDDIKSINKQKYLIQSELKKLSYKYSKLTSIVETPVSISGTVKGIFDEYKLLQVKDINFYYRKIKIEH